MYSNKRGIFLLVVASLVVVFALSVQARSVEEEKPRTLSRIGKFTRSRRDATGSAESHTSPTKTSPRRKRTTTAIPKSTTVIPESTTAIPKSTTHSPEHKKSSTTTTSADVEVDIIKSTTTTKSPRKKSSAKPTASTVAPNKIDADKLELDQLEKEQDDERKLLMNLDNAVKDWEAWLFAHNKRSLNKIRAIRELRYIQKVYTDNDIVKPKVPTVVIEKPIIDPTPRRISVANIQPK